MYRGTTPNLKIKVRTQLDLSEIKQCWVTIESAINSKEITYDMNHVMIDSDESTIDIRMSQEDTLLFGNGELKIQVRLLMNDDLAYASNIKNITMNQILKDGVINE